MNQLPDAFILRMQQFLGKECDAFIESLQTTPPVSIRHNSAKRKATFNDATTIPWCETGNYLAERPSFTFDPLFHAGTYYVQEAGSMLLEQFIKSLNIENKAVRVLDLCAAPGGKSTHLLNLLSPESVLISNELIPNRNKILQQNISKWGFSNAIVTQNQAADFQRLGEFFDVIVVDAPCSGEGLFRKDPEAVTEWSEQNVAHCISRQEEILEAVLPALKPGGYLIYSTCTYEPGENDDRIRQLIDSGFQSVKPAIVPPGIRTTKYGWQCYPHKAKAEGFYIAALKKAAGSYVEPKSSRLKSSPQYASYLSAFLEKSEDFHPYFMNNQLYAIPIHLATIYPFLSNNLYIRKAGILLGEIKGKDLIPSHELALSTDLKLDIADHALTYDEAIQFLKCDTWKLTTEQRGWMTVSYEGSRLGWIKSIPGRINNYFPRELRILKDHAK